MTGNLLEGTSLDTPEEMIEPFATAVSMTLREMAGVETVVQSTLWTSGNRWVC